MSIIQTKGVVFHDTPNGGHYCVGCKRYVHPDMVHIHQNHEVKS